MGGHGVSQEPIGKNPARGGASGNFHLLIANWKSVYWRGKQVDDFGLDSVLQNCSSFEQNIVHSCAGGTQTEIMGVGVRWGRLWLDFEGDTPTLAMPHYWSIVAMCQSLDKDFQIFLKWLQNSD